MYFFKRIIIIVTIIIQYQHIIIFNFTYSGADHFLRELIKYRTACGLYYSIHGPWGPS